MIKALNILKLLNHQSLDLHSKHGFDSFRGKDDSKIFHTQPWQRHAIILLPFWRVFQLCTYPSPNPTVTLTYYLIITCWVRGGVGVQLPRYWYWSNELNQTTQPRATWISTIRWWISFPWSWQNITAVPCLFWWQHIPHSCRLSIDKIPTRATLPSTISFKPPRFWESHDQTQPGSLHTCPMGRQDKRPWERDWGQIVKNKYYLQ